MAGSPVYGKGYHDGKHDAREEDLIIAGVVVAVGAVISGGVLLYGKVRQAHAERMEKRMLAAGESEDPDQQ